MKSTKDSLEPYTAEYVTQVSKGNPDESDAVVHERKSNSLADLYIEQSRKVVSFWTMGMNQHTRGTWCNTLAYNVHFLLNKQAKPGNWCILTDWSTKSACGTAREVGTFTHRLTSRYDG